MQDGKVGKIHRENLMLNLQHLKAPEKILQIKSVRSNIYALSETGKVWRCKIDEIQTLASDNSSPKQSQKSRQPASPKTSTPAAPSNKTQSKINWKQMSSLKSKIVEIDSGESHFLALTDTGEVYGMGDDSYGQTGTGGPNRKQGGPFPSRILRNPQKIELGDTHIRTIRCGGNHSFAISRNGQVYGWGFNNLMQLGHEEGYSAQSDPTLALFEPVDFTHLFKTGDIVDIELGADFSLFVTQNRANGFTEVFAMGHNNTGQLGSGFSRHIQKFDKVDPLSDFETVDVLGKRVALKVELSCGKSHCMALGSNGCLLTWGLNKEGQLGNRKRSFSAAPLIMSSFQKGEVEMFKATGDLSFVRFKKHRGG